MAYPEGFRHGSNLAAHAGNIKPVFLLLHFGRRLPDGAIHAEVPVMPAYPPPPFEAKIGPPDELAAQVASLPRPVVFTNGCFDILHRGHVTYLAQARALGASLVVALNTDESVRRLGKGGDRPINPLADRLAVLAALGCVDLATWFDEDTPLATILRCRPDILVKGGDWPIANIVGAAEVQAWGGSVHSIPFEYQRSTTELVSRIRGS